MFGPLLKKMMDRNPTVFSACFGIDTDYETLKTSLNKADQAVKFKVGADCSNKTSNSVEKSL